MNKLIRLELKKNKLGWYVKGAIIANLLIAGFMWFVPFIEQQEGTSLFHDYAEALLIAGVLVRATFIVFAAVLISKLVIEEYRNKTISLLFIYPIRRKKLIAAKLIIVAGLTFCTIVLSHLFVGGSFLIINTFFQYITGPLTAEFIQQQVISMLVFAFAVTGTSLIPLYFGMRNKSVPATIISSLIVIALISQHNPAFSAASIVYIPLSLAVVGILVAVWSIRNVANEDVN